MTKRQNDLSDNLNTLLKRYIYLEEQQADNQETIDHAHNMSIRNMRVIEKILKALTALRQDMNAIWKQVGVKKDGPMTPAKAYAKVAKSLGLTAKDVQVAVTSFFKLAATELKIHGSFKVAGMLNMKINIQKALPERKGWNRFFMKECTFKARPATRTVRTRPMAKLLKVVNKTKQQLKKKN